ncbi:MAG: AI-2E family transporter [Myxococcales bacterium FL481]|nr:MAG: AI-2E family transporter [Myxococcales bacterium FL481]
MSQSDPDPPASGVASRVATFRALATVAAVFIILAGLRAAADIIIPVLLAVFLAVFAMPPVNWLQRRGVPDWLAVLIVFVGVLVAFGLVSTFVVGSINDFREALPVYEAKLAATTGDAAGWLSSLGLEFSTQTLTENFDGSALMRGVGSALGALGAMLSNTVFVLLTVGFIMAEAAGLPDKIRAATGDPNADLKRYSEVLTSIHDYLRIKTQVSLVTGLLAAALLAGVGVDYIMLWALLTFMLNYVPTLGSIIAAVPPVLLAVVQFGWERALVVATGYLVINFAMGNLVEPRLMGRRLGLSSLVVFLSLVFWGWIWGPVGMLLSVPLTMLVKILLEQNDELRWLAVLLGSGAEISQRTQQGDAR